VKSRGIQSIEVGGRLLQALARAGEPMMLRDLVRDPLPGINAFAAPVFDHEGAVVLSVTAMGPERSFDARWTSAIAKALLDCTNDISRRLGFSASARK